MARTSVCEERYCSPHIATIGRVHQLRGDGRRPVHAADAAGDNRSHVELTAQRPRVALPASGNRDVLKASTRTLCSCDRFLIRLSAMPVDRYSRLGSSVSLSNGRTAILSIDRSPGTATDPLARFEPAGHDLSMELQRRFVGLLAQIGSHRVTTAAKLPQGVGTAAGQRVQRHQLAMGFFIGGARVHQGLELLHRPSGSS